MNKLENTLNELENHCKPISIFIYGSRARSDFKENSDFEIGIIMKQKTNIKREKIQKLIKAKNIRIYKFEYEDLIRYKIDSPFQKSIFFREIILGGKTLRGEKVIENMKPPPIKVLDIIQRVRFDIGIALATILSQRNKDYKTAYDEFYKSCLFGLRCLEILKLKKFPINYKEIYELSKKLNLGEYKPLVSAAYQARLKKVKLRENMAFQNVSFLNNFVEPQIVAYFQKNGNKTLVR